MSPSYERDSVAILVLPGTTGWVAQTSNSSRRLNGVFMQPDGAHGVVVGDAGEILTTSDAGAHWTRRVSSTSFNLNAVWFATSSIGWAVGNGGTVLSTTNGGTSWTSTPPGFSDNLFDVTFATPDTGWAVGSGGTILRTFNGGTSWQKQSPTAGVLNSVSFSDTRNGWAVGDLGVIFGTIDRGLSWTLVSPAITAQSLKGVSTRGTFLARAVGSQGVAPRTFDNTGTEDWELRSAGASNQLEGVMFPTDQRGFAAGTNGTGTVLRSDDSGISWGVQTGADRNAAARRLLRRCESRVGRGRQRPHPAHRDRRRLGRAGLIARMLDSAAGCDSAAEFSFVRPPDHRRRLQRHPALASSAARAGSDIARSARQAREHAVVDDGLGRRAIPRGVRRRRGPGAERERWPRGGPLLAAPAQADDDIRDLGEDRVERVDPVTAVTADLEVARHARAMGASIALADLFLASTLGAAAGEAPEKPATLTKKEIEEWAELFRRGPAKAAGEGDEAE
jgi:photosystem II stability/assembly factor-like uncharacterized protein